MLKHLREAIKLAGCPVDAVQDNPRNKNHPFIVVAGQRIPYARSPKNYHHAALRISRDIINALEGKKA